MNRTVFFVAIALALVVSACASDPSGVFADEPTTTTTEVTTTTEATSTTTTAAASTTTEAPSTTTTTADAAVAGSSELEALLERMSSSPTPASGRMEGTMEVSGLDPSESGISEATIRFATAFDAETGNSSFLMDFSSLEEAVDVDEDDPWASLAAGLVGPMEFRQVDDRVFMNAPFFALLLGAETTWVSMPAEEGTEFSSGFEAVPSDPESVIDAYGEASATVEDLGSETVNGVSATHYRVTFDTSAMIDELSAAEREELEASGVFADGILPMDVWITPEGYLVRLVVEIDGSSAEAAGEAFGSARLTYDVFDLNGDVIITAPPAGDVTPIEDLEDLSFGFDLDS
ncbi:MAG: hypothetical protein QNJ71_10140 [Acidimicrobiia bacterium]|nr:hypothetical protein [Acidimicrobiia bacterium]